MWRFKYNLDLHYRTKTYLRKFISCNILLFFQFQLFLPVKNYSLDGILCILLDYYGRKHIVKAEFMFFHETGAKFSAVVDAIFSLPYFSGCPIEKSIPILFSSAPINQQIRKEFGTLSKMASSAVERVASFAFYSRVLVFILQVCIRKSDIIHKMHQCKILALTGGLY